MFQDLYVIVTGRTEIKTSSIKNVRHTNDCESDLFI